MLIGCLPFLCKSKRYRLFRNLHTMFPLAFLVLCLHGQQALLEPPSSAYFLILPLCLYWVQLLRKRTGPVQQPGLQNQDADTGQSKGKHEEGGKENGFLYHASCCYKSSRQMCWIKCRRKIQVGTETTLIGASFLSRGLALLRLTKPREWQYTGGEFIRQVSMKLFVFFFFVLFFSFFIIFFYFFFIFFFFFCVCMFVCVKLYVSTDRLL